MKEKKSESESLKNKKDIQIKEVEEVVESEINGSEEEGAIINFTCQS